MATNITDRTIIETVLQDYIHIPYTYGDLQAEAIFDREQDRYIVVTVGWDNGMRVYSVLVHIDRLDDKIWIQQDNTEDGIATELVQAGIPKQRIVLGFRPPELRQYTEYAIAYAISPRRPTTPCSGQLRWQDLAFLQRLCCGAVL